MNEFEHNLEIIPDQQALADAWTDLAKVLVLRAQTVNPMESELPPCATGRQPYIFTYKLDPSHVRKSLADDKTAVITKATAEYYTEYTPDPLNEETIEVVSIDWDEHAQGSPVLVSRSLTIVRVRNDDQETYEAYRNEEYIDYDTGARIRRNSDTPFESDIDDENITEALVDKYNDMKVFDINDFERMRQLTEAIAHKNS